MAHGLSTLVTWNRGPPLWGLISSDTSKFYQVGEKGRRLGPGCKMAARGAAWRGGHVVGSSARASLSDLYGSSGLTGAAERETGRVSALAGLLPLPPMPPPGPVSVLRGFCLFYSRLMQRCTRFPRRVLGSRWPGDFWAVPCFLVAAPESVLPLREALRRSPGRRAGLARVWGARQRWGPSRRPAPTAGRGAGDTARRRGGSATGEARERCLLPLGDRPGPVGVCCVFAAHFMLSSGPGDGVPSGRRRERLPPLGPLRTFSLSRAVGYVEDAGPASPGRRRRCDARSSRGTPGAAERLDAGRGLRARRGRAGAPGRRRRVRMDEGAPEPLRSPQRGPVPS